MPQVNWSFSRRTDQDEAVLDIFLYLQTPASSSGCLLYRSSGLLRQSQSSSVPHLRHLHHLAFPRLRKTRTLRTATRQELLHQFCKQSASLYGANFLSVSLGYGDYQKRRSQWVPLFPWRWAISVSGRGIYLRKDYGNNSRTTPQRSNQSPGCLKMSAQSLYTITAMPTAGLVTTDLDYTERFHRANSWMLTCSRSTIGALLTRQR